MHVISKKKLREFWSQPTHRHSKAALTEWYEIVAGAEWHQFSDVKQTFNASDQVGSKTVFDVGGNKFRVIAFIDYERQRVYIRAVFDHKEYGKGTWKKDTFGDDWMPFRQMMKRRRKGRQS